MTMEETREETPQDLRNLALKVAGLLEEAGQHALHDQLNPRNLALPSTDDGEHGPRYRLETDNIESSWNQMVSEYEECTGFQFDNGLYTTAK